MHWPSWNERGPAPGHQAFAWSSRYAREEYDERKDGGAMTWIEVLPEIVEPEQVFFEVEDSWYPKAQ